jgi:hypothetical protein
VTAMAARSPEDPARLRVRRRGAGGAVDDFADLAHSKSRRGWRTIK